MDTTEKVTNNFPMFGRWSFLHCPPTTHYHLSAFNYEDYGMKAIVFITDEEDIMKIEKGGISND